MICYKNKFVQMFVGEFPTKTDFFPNWVKRNKTAKIVWIKNRGFLRKKPKTIEKKIHPNFLLQFKLKDKDCFVGVINGARVVSKSVNIVTADNCLIDELISSQGTGFSNIANYLTLPKIKDINSKIGVVSNSKITFTGCLKYCLVLI